MSTVTFIAVCECHNLKRPTIPFKDDHRGGDFMILQFENNHRQSLKCRTSKSAPSSCMNTGLLNPISRELVYF